MTLTQDCPLPVSLARRMHMPLDPETPVIEILLVDDNRADADLMEKALHEGRLNAHISRAEDGDEAMDCLYGRGRFADAPRPDLILLDLIMPRKNGLEALADIKEDAELRRIPIVIMSAAMSEEYFRKAYDLHANCCVPKPADREQFTLAVKKIEGFWLRVVRRS